GQRPRLEEYLGETPEPERSLLLRELLVLEFGYRRRSGERPTPAEYLLRFPDHAALIQDTLREAPAPGMDAPATDSRAIPQEPAPAAAPREGGTAAAGGQEPSNQAEWPAVPGYKILGELGRGGMGVVYRARHVRLDRVVALKMIRTGAHAGPEELARFRVQGA